MPTNELIDLYVFVKWSKPSGGSHLLPSNEYVGPSPTDEINGLTTIHLLTSPQPLRLKFFPLNTANFIVITSHVPWRDAERLNFLKRREGFGENFIRQWPDKRTVCALDAKRLRMN